MPMVNVSLGAALATELIVSRVNVRIFKKLFIFKSDALI